jgi:hypothetical protein
MSMLTTEWNWDIAKKVWQDEAREEGIGVGLAKGHEGEKLIIAKNLLSEGSTPEFVHRITGLSLDAIERLRE